SEFVNCVKNTSGSAASATTWRNTTSVTSSIGASTKKGRGRSRQKFSFITKFLSSSYPSDDFNHYILHQIQENIHIQKSTLGSAITTSLPADWFARLYWCNGDRI